MATRRLLELESPFVFNLKDYLRLTRDATKHHNCRLLNPEEVKKEQEKIEETSWNSSKDIIIQISDEKDDILLVKYLKKDGVLSEASFNDKNCRELLSMSLMVIQS